jgi:hypothetical protein
MQANAELHPLGWLSLGILGSHRALDFHCGAESLDRAPEFGENAIARTVEYSAAVVCDDAIDERPVLMQESDSGLFRLVHMPAVADHVRHKESR